MSAQNTLSQTFSTTHPKAKRILDFWFEGSLTGDKFKHSLVTKWFEGGANLDKEISDTFGSDVAKLASGEYHQWRDHPHNNLAAIILSDQFTRSIYRGTPRMFELDPMARDYAQHLLVTKMVDALGDVERTFVPLPFEHTEDLTQQQKAVALFTQYVAEAKAKYGDDHPFVVALSGSKAYAEKHRDVIASYGRFPHRNRIVGRESTRAEIKGLANGTIPKFG